MALDDKKLKRFVMEKMLPETAAAMRVLMAIIGDKVGLFMAMAGAGPITLAALADKTGTLER